MLARMAPLAKPGDSGPGQAPARSAARSVLLSELPLEAKLAAVTSGDPLGLCPLAARRVRERSLYLDPDRVHEEACFNVVALSVVLEAEDEFDGWLIERVDEAIDNLVRRDGEALRRGAFEADLVRESGEYLGGCWGLTPEEGVTAAARFNQLPMAHRRTFFALLVEHETIEACIEAGLGPREVLRERAVRAIEAILGPRPTSITRASLPGEDDRAKVGGPELEGIR